MVPFRLLEHQVVRWALAVLWCVNGLWCKMLGAVPRHEAIVAAILGEEHAPLLTRVIGVAEIIMALWILSGRWYQWCAIIQIAVILTMNMIEFLLVPELLLWGRLNLLFAVLLCLLIVRNAFPDSTRAHV